jgi:hypothetical protein
MSTENLTQPTTGEKIHDAGENTKSAFENVMHDAGQALRDGADLFKADLENVKDAVNEQLHRNAAEAEQARREGNLRESERLESVANELKNNAQADVDELKQQARKP